ncbi:hypothetical protein Misp01_47750 [Microtetraspora sp. NBRC 13810]|uniref:hypothetical protein n=1 Tax=Microtetraspora sp. NBRC 13810 TaxID=3030990 RepID=UPI0024A31AAF|nr:hypothetical protein [Microtetraspora sp. NBRC 13810]GLW09646.1 hypothetical protein Misp01_47750 [Microtetraspora sp. NBRC 13810]
MGLQEAVRSSASARPGSPTGRRYYVNSESGDDSATGTAPDTAWRTLDQVNATVFQPGDSLLLRRGSAWHGVLRPQGSGTAGDPIVVGAYGTGARPVINGGGARAGVFLRNVQGWEIRDLEVTNIGEADGTTRTGVYVLLEDYGVGAHYVVDDVHVHDVVGCDAMKPELDNSGGIVFKAAGSDVPTGFDGIQVSNSTVSGVDNVGIGTLSQWNRRDLYPAGSNTFVPMTNVRVFRNRLSDLGGDGILLQNGIDAVAEHNRVDGFGLRTNESRAGILAFNSDRPIVQFNEISGGVASPPSFALSVDAGNAHLVYQYNYSHDNDGPFMLFCALTGSHADGATVRYNVSENDRDLLLGTFEIPVVANGCDNAITNVRFYNNVIYSPAARALIGSRGDHTPIEFTNNIFVGRPEGSTINDAVGVYDHNLYHNVPVPPGHTNPLVADPCFTDPGTGVLGYRLRHDSPAVAAGVPIPGDGGRDLHGAPIPAPPNLGAHQAPS